MRCKAEQWCAVLAAHAGMTWAEGDEWSVEVELEPGPYQFKLVVMGPDGAASYWEPGSNREVVVSALLCIACSSELYF